MVSVLHLFCSSCAVPVRYNYTARITYHQRGELVSLSASDNTANNSSGHWILPTSSANTSSVSRQGRTLLIKSFMEEVHGGRYDFVEKEGGLAAIVETHILREAGTITL